MNGLQPYATANPITTAVLECLWTQSQPHSTIRRALVRRWMVGEYFYVVWGLARADEMVFLWNESEKV